MFQNSLSNTCLFCKNDSAPRSICTGCQSLLTIPEYSCSICAISISSKDQTCGHCQKATPYFSKIIFACDYKFPADNWVKGLKFANQLSLSRVMAETMAEKIPEQSKAFSITPIPLHKKRLRKRGYNQAYEIAKELALFTKTPLVECLSRNKETKMQAQLKFNQRHKNVTNAFEVIENVKNQNILLVDDVLTSGSTMNECAKVLKKAGAAEVVGVVFSRKQPW